MVAVCSQIAARSVVMAHESMTSLVIPIHTTPAGQKSTATADMMTPTTPAATEMTCNTFDVFICVRGQEAIVRIQERRF